MPDGKPKADVLDKNEWTYIVDDLKKHGRALPVDANRDDCIVTGLAENERIRRNAERMTAAMDKLSAIPSDSEPA